MRLDHWREKLLNRDNSQQKALEATVLVWVGSGVETVWSRDKEVNSR